MPIALQEAFPSDGILAEESSDNMTRREYKRIWCIDPIDGTREFVAGRDEFVVMVGLAIAGCARLGVIYQPLQDILFWGEVNKGAWVEKGGSISALHVSNQERLQNAHAMVSRQRFGPKAKNTLEKLGISQRTAIGSIGLKSLWIAQGLADLYVSFASKTYEWDICAPQAIVEAAGGKFSDTQGNPILYNKVYPYHDTGIIAANAHVYPAVLHAIAEHT
jgi:3'(2'), 5'-bisphosphate nucleotidase